MKYLPFICLFILSSCRVNYAVSEIADDQQKFDAFYSKKDTLIESRIIPYRDSLQQTMHIKIAEAAKELNKAKPESTLGNLLADATRYMAEKQLNKTIDIGIVNYGGIRVPSINKGPITIGNVYELMPFDNYLTVVYLDGETLLSICNTIAEKGGWPVSGLSFTIANNTAQQIKVNGQPLVLTNVYRVALSDYLANGGDNLSMLKTIPQENTNILLREAFIMYFKLTNQQNRPIDADIENRISYE